MSYISLLLLNLGLEYGHMSGKFINTDHSIGTISNTTQSKNYTTPLSVVPSRRLILLPSHDMISTRNTSLLDRAQMEGLSYMNYHKYE
jgi:hypothetical protein